MTREELQQRDRERKREERRREKEAWEAARGPLDLPFLMLVLILLAIGLIMLLSASFPSAQADGDAFYYIKRQMIFAGLGVFAMFSVGKINYQRFRGFATIALIVGVVLTIELPFRKEKEKNDEQLQRIKDEIRRLKEEQEQ